MKTTTAFFVSFLVLPALASAAAVGPQDVARRADQLCAGYASKNVAQKKSCLAPKVYVACIKATEPVSVALAVGVDPGKEMQRRFVASSVEQCLRFAHAEYAIDKIERAVRHLIYAERGWAALGKERGVRVLGFPEQLKNFSGVANAVCENWMDKAGEFWQPVVGFLGEWGSKATAACTTEFMKGFWCNVPQFIEMVGAISAGLIDEAGKGVCARFQLAPGPWAALDVGGLAIKAVCGLAQLVVRTLGKWGSCFKKLSEGGALAVTNAVLNFIFTQGWKVGCGMMGQLAFDGLIMVLTGAAAMPAVIGKWFSKIAKLAGEVGIDTNRMVSALKQFAERAPGAATAQRVGRRAGAIADATNLSTWLEKVGRKEISFVDAAKLNTAQSFVQNAVKEFSACDPDGAPAIPAPRAPSAGDVHSAAVETLALQIRSGCFGHRTVDERTCAGREIYRRCNRLYTETYAISPQDAMRMGKARQLATECTRKPIVGAWGSFDSQLDLYLKARAEFDAGKR
ncbi:MAG: hypothetical protein HYY84_06770 [Deltaproteobacteria bacterium]|nr:hypothetical protein [Deltaproteobacteria bacterium]